jgi:amino acid transporter
MWNANCGASFEWVGRAINPYLGFLTGWLIIVAYIIGTVAEILLLGPSFLAVFGSTSPDTVAAIAIGSAASLVMLAIAVVGIRFTARTQVGMALIEYLVLIGLAIAGLVVVLRHHPGSLPMTKGWLSPAEVGGKGRAATALVYVA